MEYELGLTLVVIIVVNRINIPLKKRLRVSLCDATHCKSAKALQTRFEAAAVSWEGLSSG